MSDEYPNTDLAARLDHLRRVAIKELHYLTYTAEGLKQADPQFRWLDAVEQNAELTERLDAFVSRFCRLQDTLGDKLLPVYLSLQFEPIGTVLDNLNRAEKPGGCQATKSFKNNKLMHWQGSIKSDKTPKIN